MLSHPAARCQPMGSFSDLDATEERLIASSNHWDVCHDPLPFFKAGPRDFGKESLGLAQRDPVLGTRA